MTHNINFDDGIKDFFHPFYPKPLNYDFSPVKTIFNGDTKPSLEKMIDKKNDLPSKDSLASKQYLNDIFTNLFSTAKLIEKDTSKVVLNDVIETDPIYNKKETTTETKKEAKKAKTKAKTHNYQLVEVEDGVEEGADKGVEEGAGAGAEEGEWTDVITKKHKKLTYEMVRELFSKKDKLEPTWNNHNKFLAIYSQHKKQLTDEEKSQLEQKIKEHAVRVNQAELEKEEAKKAKKAKAKK